MVVHNHKPECHAVKDWFASLHGHGHSEGSYNQNVTVSIVTIIRCKRNRHTLTVKLLPRMSLSTHGGGGWVGRESFAAQGERP